MDKKYFEVTAKCGHVGKNKYIPITFFVNAESAKEAAEICRDIPRVKHDHRDAILNVAEITNTEFVEGIRNNECDPYLQAKNIQQQRKVKDVIATRILDEKTSLKPSKEIRKKKIYHGKEQLKNPKKKFMDLSKMRFDDFNENGRLASSIKISHSVDKNKEYQDTRSLIFSVLENCNKPEVFLKRLETIGPYRVFQQKTL